MGIFDQTPENDNLVARMIAKQQGREPTPEEIAEHNKIQDDAVNLASGTIGSIGGPASKFRGIASKLGQATPEAINVAEQTAPSMIEKYRQAVANTKVRQMDTPPPLYAKVRQADAAPSKLGKVIEKEQVPEKIDPASNEEHWAMMNRLLGIK